MNHKTHEFLYFYNNEVSKIEFPSGEVSDIAVIVNKNWNENIDAYEI